MTVKDLKELISDIPDNTVVVASDKGKYTELTDMYVKTDDYIGMYETKEHGNIFVVC